jgi:hypothetical protein
MLPGRLSGKLSTEVAKFIFILGDTGSRTCPRSSLSSPDAMQEAELGQLIPRNSSKHFPWRPVGVSGDTQEGENGLALALR